VPHILKTEHEILQEVRISVKAPARFGPGAFAVLRPDPVFWCEKNILDTFLLVLRD
jgi:hypothetical protein